MHVTVYSATLDTNESGLMRIEASYGRGYSGMQTVGHTSEVCRDGKERARAALEAVDVEIPPQKILVSYTPAETKKEGGHFDLPLAICLASLIIDRPTAVRRDRWIIGGALGLDGSILPIRGAVALAISALQNNMDGLIVPTENLREAKAVMSTDDTKSIAVLGFSHLREVLDWLFYGKEPNCVSTTSEDTEHNRPTKKSPNFNDMVLSKDLRLAAMVVALGRHNLILRGTPGSGKSMFASRLASIFPNLSAEEKLCAMRLRGESIRDANCGILANRPPFRAPHHHASAAAILGSDRSPGEISLAHGGILFLDELPEFRRDILEGLREPMESGEVTIARSARKVVWPANTTIVAACNNCPCGWSSSNLKKCRCSIQTIRAYRARISGPISERIDIHLNTQEPDASNEHSELLGTLWGNNLADQSQKMRELVNVAFARSAARNAELGIRFNRDIPAAALAEASGLERTSFSELVAKHIDPGVSRRSFTKVLRVSRSLADLRLSPSIDKEDLIQASAWQSEAAAKVRGEHLMGG